MQPQFGDVENMIIEAITIAHVNVFIHGPGGTGKSFLIKHVAELLKKYKVNYAVTASTGAAAVNVEGSTLHRFTGIGLGNEDEFKLYQKIHSKKKVLKRWRMVEVLIVDEISMIGGGLFDKLNWLAKKLRSNDKPFGGIRLVLSGDMLQLPPIRDTWIFESKAWSELDLVVYTLNVPKRYDDSDYFSMLLRFRSACYTEKDLQKLRERQDAYKTMTNLQDIKPTVLHSYKIDVDYHNQLELDKLEGEQVMFSAIDILDSKQKLSEEQRNYYITVLNEAIPAKIIFKKGCQVMLRKNLDIESGLINGSRGIVLDIKQTEGFVKVRFLNKIVIDIYREQWDVKDDEVLATRMQIPLILAWSYTIHKSQGCTLDYAVCDLGINVFAFSQAYVALSRVKNLNGLYLTNFDEFSIKTDPKALEFVNSIDERPTKFTYTEELIFKD